MLVVILPDGMQGQVKEVSAELLRGLEIVYVARFPEVVPWVLSAGAPPTAGTSGEESE